jgi:hypothetical protein
MSTAELAPDVPPPPPAAGVVLDGVELAEVESLLEEPHATRPNTAKAATASARESFEITGSPFVGSGGVVPNSRERGSAVTRR